jgi:hypothetical protein
MVLFILELPLQLPLPLPLVLFLPLPLLMPARLIIQQLMRHHKYRKYLSIIFHTTTTMYVPVASLVQVGSECSGSQLRLVIHFLCPFIACPTDFPTYVHQLSAMSSTHLNYYIYTYVCIEWFCICTHMHNYNGASRLGIHACMHLCMHLCMYVCNMYVCISMDGIPELGSHILISPLRSADMNNFASGVHTVHSTWCL